MKKEVVIAIIVGFVLGLAITFGIYTAQKALKNKQVPTESPSSQIDLTPSHSITITSPENEALVDNEEVTLTGTTTSLSSITIISQDSQIITTANEQGNFTATLELSGGANPINITSYDPDGNQAETQIVIAYSTQFEDKSEEPIDEE